ncbi:thermonuclease family protein [Radicibacter daui]|uniref:thermonuclease family protein n=1 Tax=Radicibacter daui TaxID=3064829 RepID=UPI004046B6A6
MDLPGARPTKQSHPLRTAALVLAGLAVVAAAALTAGVGGRDAASPAAAPAAAALPVTVLDGDTIALNGVPLRLAGIDAPELGQTCRVGGQMRECGLESAYALRKLVAVSGGGLECQPATAGSVLCYAGGRDLGLMQVAAGHAVVTASADPSYADGEDKARTARLGIWGTSFLSPSEWRAGARLEGVPPAYCAVKLVVHNDRPYFVTRLDDNFQGYHALRCFDGLGEVRKQGIDWIGEAR